MNSVVLAVAVMILLSLARLNVVVALILGALAGGMAGGLSLNETMNAFTEGLGGGAPIALNYALLGGFAVALARSGITERIADAIVARVDDSNSQGTHTKVRLGLFVMLLVLSISSQNVIPVHIAFIPIVIPPLLHVMSKLNMDRRQVACILTFGLMAPYMCIPIGFGGIFQRDILFSQLMMNGFQGAEASNIPIAMALPVSGMVMGLVIAIFWSYRKPRKYIMDVPDSQKESRRPVQYSTRNLITVLLSIAVALAVQLYTDSVLLGALAGFLIMLAGGILRWKNNEPVFVQGMQMMCMIGFIMITAAGFASVLRATGDIPALVSGSIALIGQSKAVAAFIMLLVGLLITMGIGSSFSTVPIIASIYVPACAEFGFSPLATLALVGTAAALGDAGSPSSDSTLGPTMGLNVDGQHSHIWDTVVPTFLHYNLPLLAFGWLAAMIL